MAKDYNKVVKDYINIKQEHAKKISLLSTNYHETLKGYKTVISPNDENLNDLLLLLERIQSIFSTESQQLQKFLEGCETIKDENKEINTDVGNRNNFNKISNEFMLKEKKIMKMSNDLDNNFKSLYNIFESIENSLALSVITKENKVLNESEITNNCFLNGIEKEKIILKSKEEISQFKNDYFNSYDEAVKLCEEIAADNINNLKYNIDFFISLLNNFYSFCSREMEESRKIIVMKEVELNFSDIMNKVMVPFEKEATLNKYLLKIVTNKYTEDKTKKLDLLKIEKNGYIIKDNKVFLKEEDIYEIAKIMFNKFQFIDQSNYNINEEKIKIEVKNLTNKLLSVCVKDKETKFSELKKLEPITDNEIDELFKYLDNSFNRIALLKVLNLFRSSGIYAIPEREYEILKNIFIKIAGDIVKDKDFSCTHYLLILSCTFYLMKEGKKIYLQHYLKNHEIFSELEIIEKYLTELIEENIEKMKLSGDNNTNDDESTQNFKINNILNTQLFPFCDTMLEFGMNVENLNKVIEPIMEKYKANDDVKSMISDLIKSKQMEMESSTQQTQ